MVNESMDMDRAVGAGCGRLSTNRAGSDQQDEA